MRINVVGSSGSGKSTFSKRLAHELNAPYQELDQLYWLPNWGEKADELFIEDIRSFCQQSAWVLDGNYHRTHPIKWQQVDAVIWLDYSRRLIFWRALSRALKRSLSGKELWPGTGNVETLTKTFFSKDSVLWWSISNYTKIRQRYLSIMADPAFAHIEFVQLKNPTMAAGFIQNINSTLNRASG